MPVNHTKEYFIFIHTDVVYLQLLARYSNGCQYSNFENWCLKMKSCGRYIAYTFIMKILVASWFSTTGPSLFHILDTYYLLFILIHSSMQCRAFGIGAKWSSIYIAALCLFCFFLGYVSALLQLAHSFVLESKKHYCCCCLQTFIPWLTFPENLLLWPFDNVDGQKPR